MIKEMLKQAATFENSGQLDLAQNIYNVALQLLPEADHESRGYVHLLRGRLCYRLHNNQGALDDIRKAIELHPTIAEQLNGEFSNFYKEHCNC